MHIFRLLLVDDHEIVRRGLREILKAEPVCEVVGECGDGREAVSLAADLKPDIAVLDVAMPLLNGLEATRQILKASPHTKVLILTMHDSDYLIREALEAGAQGLLLKSDAARDLITAVQHLIHGKTYFTPRAAQMIVDGFLRDDVRSESDPGPARILTPREREIVQLVAEGKSSKEVAAILGLSVKTVETHRANLMRKLGCHSTSDLVHYAIRHNLIDA